MKSIEIKFLKIIGITLLVVVTSCAASNQGGSEKITTVDNSRPKHKRYIDTNKKKVKVKTLTAYDCPYFDSYKSKSKKKREKKTEKTSKKKVKKQQ